VSLLFKYYAVDFLAFVYAVNVIKPFTIAQLGFESVFRREEDVR
jgi:hypothetical protein